MSDDIQGQPAIVTREISLAGPGEISYELPGELRYALPPVVSTPETLPAGTEVVIDRIEDGVAFVEEWAVVEQRL